MTRFHLPDRVAEASRHLSAVTGYVHEKKRKKKKEIIGGKKKKKYVTRYMNKDMKAFFGKRQLDCSSSKIAEKQSKYI